MHLTTGHRAKSPWALKALNKTVYTLDGFCWYLYKEPALVSEDLVSEGFLRWLAEDMAMVDTAKALSGITTIAGKAKALFDLCPVTRKLPRTAVMATLAMAKKGRLKAAADEAMASGHFRKALSIYRQSLKIEASFEGFNNMGIAAMGLGEYDVADKAFRRSLTLNPTEVAKMNLVRLNHLKEDWQGMLGVLEEGETLPDSGDVWYYYAIAFEGLGRLEESAGAFSRAMDEGPKFSYLQGIVRVSTKEFLKDWVKHRRLQGDFRLYVQGWLDRYDGDGVGYEECLESAAEVAQNPEGYWWELSEHALEEGQVIRALAFANRIEPRENNGEALTMLKASIAAQAGNRDVYKGAMDGLLDRWKAEVRRNSGRQAGL